VVKDTRQLRAAIFERSGIAIDESDPIMAVLVASAQQTEEIGARLMNRTSLVRVVVATALVGLACAVIGASSAWYAANERFSRERAEWLQEQADPRLARLLSSDEGRAGIRLAELGVAALLAKCSGRRSWRIQEGYCIPTTPEGRPDGFRINESK